MRTDFIRWLVIPLLIPGSMMISQCSSSSERSEARQQSKTEAIVTARTLGLAMMEDNNFEGAETEFRKLVSLAPDEAIGYANLGLVYLRTGDYDLAKKNLLKALDLSPEDPNIRLNLATVYKYLNQQELFIDELKKNIEINPRHVQSLYRLAESYSGSNDPASLRLREQYLAKTVDASSANIVPRLYLTEVLLRMDSTDRALAHLREVRRIFPEFSDEALEQYTRASDAMVAGNDQEALTALLMFHNYLKLTNPYQNGITQLTGLAGSSAGVPVFTFSKPTWSEGSNDKSILESIRFTDITSQAGLDLLDGDGSRLSGAQASATHIALGDFNHDGSDDIYLGTYMPGSGSYRSFMLKSDLGKFIDVAATYDLKQGREESYASFTDYDNDGWFDLLVISQGVPVLKKSIDKGVYEDVSKHAFENRIKDVTRALYFDMDHEGDLDLLVSGNGANRLMRNNGDGTFTDFTSIAGVEGDQGGSSEVCFGDFDDDGDMDLFIVNRNGTCQLYSNIREGKFRDVTMEVGLAEIRAATNVATADYNNDGYLDLFVAGSSTETWSWYLNTGNGSFIADHAADSLFNQVKAFHLYDAAFFDFDNDGSLDLLITGDPGVEGSAGGILLHNNGQGAFENSTHLLPPDFEGARGIAFGDFNEDGDLDIFLAGLHGGVKLLRNDGGNLNHHLKVRLLGIRTGSGKNNHYGIGAKIELRAGNHYQMQVVNSPNVYFGLAGRSDVDVVRILWTNGTSQNIFAPDINQNLVEEQQLKGSCPFLYTWNGEAYEFIKDVMWRSALGMPMGIMGKEQSYAFADASEDYHRIPGEMLKQKGGKYTIQFTEELWETIYLDQVQLLVLDHPDSCEVFVDEQFVPPPYPPLAIHAVTRKIQPVSATDGSGNDLLELLLEKDDRYLPLPENKRYQGITGTSTLVIDPGQHTPTGNLSLFLSGWIFPTDASINMALSQGENEQVMPPCLQVINRKGEWETVIENIGFPQGKNKTVIVPLEGVFLSDDHRIRIITNMEIHWDQVFFARPSGAIPVKLTRMDPSEADHHYRGFSRMYRKDHGNGPHWFDYSSVTTGPKWRDLQGFYTRYGDVRELLLAPDNKYIIANAGDETTICFNAEDAGDLPEGWSRDFLLYSVGWVKDGDMNTAEGNRVEPLPFHGMSSYPYKSPDSYPHSEELDRYHKMYNTREVTDRAFSRAIFEMQ
ncbi:MAG: FG-GAP-like repeat-containing protein [Bacteroidales bacterium]